MKTFIKSVVIMFLLTQCGDSDDKVGTGIDPASDGCLCLNDLQVIGSHNSYKIAVEEPVLSFLRNIDASLAEAIEYEHIPIVEQLELGLRNLEFDVFYDPDGGRFSSPQGIEIVEDAGETPLPYDQEGLLNQSGLKMFHIQDVDFRSHHLLFKNGLEEVKKWSDDNPDHTPIFILINAKDDQIPLTVNPLPFTREALQQIDNEIRDVFPSNQLIVPDDIRNGASSLEAAVLTNGWLALDESRGKILFVLDENETKTDRYLSSYPGLANAAMFVNVEEGNPEAGFRIINDPIRDFNLIQDLVSKGYMVRTRADSNTEEARNNDFSRLESAILSRAQVISTDYYIKSALFDSEFQVSFDDGSFERLQNQ